MRLAVIELAVADLETSCGFYGNALGLHPGAYGRTPTGEGAIAMFEIPRGPELCLRQASARRGGETVTLAFDVHGSAALSVRLVEAGGTLLGTSQSTPALSVTRVSDPDGNIIELLERPPGDIAVN